MSDIKLAHELGATSMAKLIERTYRFSTQEGYGTFNECITDAKPSTCNSMGGPKVLTFYYSSNVARRGYQLQLYFHDNKDNFCGYRWRKILN